MTRPDHAPYVHAVARALDDAGFDVQSVGGHDWSPRGGHILLGAQDSWDACRHDDADVLWDERDGWRCRWGGLTYDLHVSNLATPARVVMAVGHLLGPTPQLSGVVDLRDVRAEFGTPEFDATLAAYVTEEAR